MTKPQVDEWLDEAVASSDPAVREGLYQKIQDWNAQQVLIVPLYVPSEITVASRKVLRLTSNPIPRVLVLDRQRCCRWFP